MRWNFFKKIGFGEWRVRIRETMSWAAQKVANYKLLLQFTGWKKSTSQRIGQPPSWFTSNRNMVAVFPQLFDKQQTYIGESTSPWFRSGLPNFTQWCTYVLWSSAKAAIIPDLFCRKLPQTRQFGKQSPSGSTLWDIKQQYQGWKLFHQRSDARCSRSQSRLQSMEGGTRTGLPRLYSLKTHPRRHHTNIHCSSNRFDILVMIFLQI